MFDFLSFMFAIGVGFGTAFWVFGTLLDKSNNFGDSRGNKYEYHAFVKFTTRRDKMSNSEKNSFSMFAQNIDNSRTGPKGSELVRRLTPEELKKYRSENVPRGAYQSDHSQINVKDTVDEFEEWEKQAGFDQNLKGIFKPLDEDPNP